MDKHTLNVPGITCGHCVSAITTNVGRLDGVSSVDVDLARKTVTVTGTVSRDAVRVAIDDAGYAVAA